MNSWDVALSASEGAACFEQTQNKKVASLFAGIGGADLGLMGGFSFLDRFYPPNPYEVVFANDIDKLACETYRENIGDHIIEGDIKDINPHGIPDHDLTVGGFPCQPFSIVGLRKGINDARGTLVYEMAGIIDAKQPSAFIAENVKGILSSSKGEDFKRILKTFEAPGYNLKWALLNSADYGVPQRRERVFIVGIRNDLKADFAFPEPTHAERPLDPWTKPWTPLGKVLEDNVPEKYVFSKGAVQGMLRANKAFNKGRAQDLSKPCATITTHLAKVSLNGTDPVLRLPSGKMKFRRFTPREAARIQSFPESYKLLSNDLVRYKQIGNAIPPALFWHIAKAVYEQILQ